MRNPSGKTAQRQCGFVAEVETEKHPEGYSKGGCLRSVPHSSNVEWGALLEAYVSFLDLRRSKQQ